MKMSSAKEMYEEQKKKHALPDFNGLNREFEISAIEAKDFLLREIRRKMDERIEACIKVLSSILQPDTNIAEIHECKDFSDSEKEEIYELYKKLMIIHDSAIVAGISCDDSKDADFISETFKGWDEIKKKMLHIAEKMRDSWKNDADIQEELGYLG